MLKELLDLFERFVVSQESIAESTRKMADVACVPSGANICAGPLTAAPVADPVDQGGPVDYNLMSLDARMLQRGTHKRRILGRLGL